MSEKLKKTNKKIKELLTIDDDLHSASRSTPMIHSQLMEMLGEETLKLKDYLAKEKNFQLERWKFYSGKQPDEYYKKYPLPERILKTDIERYMKADSVLTEFSKIVDEQTQCVKALEAAVKECGHRGFHIKTALDFMKFESGA